MGRPATGSASSPRPSGADKKPAAKPTGGGSGGAGRGGGGLADRPARGRLTGRAAVLVLVLAALVVSYASSLRTWADQRSEVAALREENAERKAKVKAYESQVERWKDPAYVEAQARTRFGWVKPGEVGYVVVDENGRPVDGTDGSSGSDGSGGGSSDAWWETLWGSVEKAGNPPKPKPTKEPRSEPADRIGPSGEDGSESSSSSDSSSESGDG